MRKQLDGIGKILGISTYSSMYTYKRVQAFFVSGKISPHTICIYTFNGVQRFFKAGPSSLGSR